MHAIIHKHFFHSFRNYSRILRNRRKFWYQSVIVFHSKQMKFSTSFFNDNWNFSIIVLEKFAFIRKFSIHKSHFVNFFLYKMKTFVLSLLSFILNKSKRLKNRITLKWLKRLKKKLTFHCRLWSKNQTHFSKLLWKQTFFRTKIFRLV